MYLMLDFDYYNIAEYGLKSFSNAVRCCVKCSVKDVFQRKSKIRNLRREIPHKFLVVTYYYIMI